MAKQGEKDELCKRAPVLEVPASLLVGPGSPTAVGHRCVHTQQEELMATVVAVDAAAPAFNARVGTHLPALDGLRGLAILAISSSC